MVARRAFCAALVALPLCAYAQRRLWRIGYHTGGSAESNGGWLDAFRKGMAELGWSEANDYVLDARYADGDDAASIRIANELVGTQPDLILTTAEGSILPLTRVTKTIPIVFANAADPVGNGYAVSLQRPGRNVTGITALTPDLAAKRLQLLKEAVPQMQRVVLLFEPMDAAAVSQVKSYEAAAERAKVHLSPVQVRQVSDIDVAFKAAEPAPDAYVVVSGRFLNIHRRTVVERLLKTRAPAITSNVIWAEAGLLMTYAPSTPANFRRAATYVDKILKGAKPSELAIEQPTTFELTINARTAKELALTIPQSLRLRADRIIE
jgi:putative ABC transport system substrate-binding protein